MTKQLMQRVSHYKYLLFLIIWVLSGAVLFYTQRHIAPLFLIMIYCWLLVGCVYWVVFKWSWKVVLIAAPIVAFVICVPLGYAYLMYTAHEYDRALHEFVTCVIEEDNTSDFSCPSTWHACPRCDWSLWASDFTVDYDVIAVDAFGVERDWTVHFANGVEYFITMVQDSPGHWEVCAQRIAEPVP